MMEKQKIALPAEKPLTLFIATLGEKAQEKGFSLLSEIRQAGISAEINYLGKSLKSQMRLADSLKAQSVLIVGDEELKKGSAVLRKMADGMQEDVSFSDLRNKLVALNVEPPGHF